MWKQGTDHSLVVFGEVVTVSAEENRSLSVTRSPIHGERIFFSRQPTRSTTRKRHSACSWCAPFRGKTSGDSRGQRRSFLAPGTSGVERIRTREDPARARTPCIHQYGYQHPTSALRT